MVLEHIIKQFLFEQRQYTAVVKRAPGSTVAKSKEAGAEYAFFVRFRFKPGSGVIPTDDQLYTELANIVSENSSVGKSSKYANGKYVYAVSNRLKESDNRLLFNIWIYNKTVWDSVTALRDTTASDGYDVVIMSGPSPHRIGNSPLRPIHNEFVAFDRHSPEQKKELAMLQTINTTPVSQETADLGSNVNIQQPEIEMPADDIIVPSDEEEIAAEKTVENKIEYPYTGKDGKVFYTTAPSDDWVYTYANNIWYGMKKPEFEQYRTAGGISPRYAEIKNKTAINTLNKLANITPVTVKQKVSDTQVINTKTDNNKDFYMTYNNQEYVYRDGQFYFRPNGPLIKDYEKRTLITDPILIKNIKEKSTGVNIETAPWKTLGGTKFTPGPAVFKARPGGKINVFNWDTKSKKWVNYGYYTVEKKSPGNKIGQSKDKTRTLIQFPKGKYWVYTDALK